MNGELITIITTITTFVTALATFLTVVEMRKQRQNAYRPDIFVSDSFRNFYGFDQDDTFNQFRYEISKESLEEKEEKVSSSMLWYEIQIYNIGFGAAKFIQYEWEFNTKKLYDLLMSVNNSNTFIFEYQKEKDSEGIVVRTSGDEYIRSFTSDKRSNNLQFDYLNSSNTGKNNQAITIPDIYINLLSYYLCVKYDMKDDKSSKIFIHDDLKEIPSLKITLRYKDIANKNHKKKFLLTFTAMGNFSTQKKPFSSEKLGTYLLVSKEID